MIIRYFVNYYTYMLEMITSDVIWLNTFPALNISMFSRRYHFLSLTDHFRLDDHISEEETICPYQ